MLRPQSVFVRNDDVREVLDESLVYLTERLVDIGVLLIHAVEPLNVSPKVVKWLIEKKEAHPERISIIQHGLDHSIKTHSPIRGEFGGGRSFEEQHAEIRQGKILMNRHFGSLWDKVFSFPFGSYDQNTLKALMSEEFRYISTGIRFTRKRRILNLFGRLLNVKELAGKNIVYFNEKVPGYHLYEFPVVLNNTKKYTLTDSGIQKACPELQTDWASLPRYVKCCGVLTHHRFNTREDIDELAAFLQSINVMSPTVKELFDGCG